MRVELTAPRQRPPRGRSPATASCSPVTGFRITSSRGPPRSRSTPAPAARASTPLLRTSRRGVFAAGNLLRGAAIADVAALEGVTAARGIADFLERGDWPRPAEALSIAVEPPLAWIAPSRSLASMRRRRPAAASCSRRREFRERASVEVSQGGVLLHAERYRSAGAEPRSRSRRGLDNARAQRRRRDRRPRALTNGD